MAVKIKVEAVLDITKLNSDLQKLSGSIKPIKLTLDVDDISRQLRAVGNSAGNSVGNSVGDSVKKAFANTDTQLFSKLSTALKRYDTMNSKTKSSINPFSAEELTAASKLYDKMLDQKGSLKFDLADIGTYAKDIQEFSKYVDLAGISYSKFSKGMTADKSINREAAALSNLTRQIHDYKSANPNLIYNRSGYEKLNSVEEQVGLGKISSSEAKKAFSEIRGEMNTLGLESETLGGRLKRLFGEHFNTAVAMAGLHALQSGFREIVTDVRNIDAAMTELRKVTNETAATYDKFLLNAGQRAQTFGATITDTINSTADFARLGYNLEEASDLSNTAVVYKNVGDGISDIGTASEAVISTMKAFDIEAENSMSIADKYNEVGNRFAISSGGIGEAMKRSASAMAEANNTLNESIGLVVAANDVVQNPEVVGTALKTLSLRLRGAKVELEAAGEDTDGMAESVSELREKLLALTGQKVDIMLNKDTFKSTFQIIKEMSQVWDSMTDINQAAALELMGGKRQANVLSGMLANFSDAEAAAKAAGESSGSALKENEVFLDSINGKVLQLQASYESFSTSVLNSDVAKWFIDLANAVTQGATAFTEFAGAGSALGGVIGLAADFKNAGITKLVDDASTYSGKRIVNTFKSVATKEEILQIEKYNTVLKENADSAAQYAKELENYRIGDYLGNLKGQEATVEEFSKGLKNVSVGSKLAATGMTLLNAAANVFIGMAIGFVVEKLVEGLYNIASASEQAIQKARELTDTYSANTASLDEYQTRTAELQDSLSSGTLTYDEAKDKRLELMQIQEALIDKYGNEAGAIELVTSAIQNQNDAWDALKKKEYDSWKSGVSEVSIWSRFNPLTYKNGIFAGTSALNDAKDYMESLQDFKYSSWGDLHSFSKPAETLVKTLKEAQKEAESGLSEYLSIDFNGNTVIRGLPQELENNNVVERLKKSYVDTYTQALSAIDLPETEIQTIIEHVTDSLDSANDKLYEGLNKYQDTYSTYLDGYLRYYSDYTEEYQSFTDAKQEYDEALIAGNQKNINLAETQLKDAYSNIMEEVGKDGNKNYEQFFKNLFPDMENQIKIWDFQKQLGDELTESLSKLSTNDLYDALSYEGENPHPELEIGFFKNKDDLEAVTRIAQEMGIIADDSVSSVSTLIKILADAGMVSGAVSDEIAELTTKFQDVKTAAAGVSEEISLVNAALSSQGTGAGIDIAYYEKLIAFNTDYADALEYNNGVMQLNAEKTREIASIQVSSQIAKTTTQIKLQNRQFEENKNKIAETKKKLEELGNSQSDGSKAVQAHKATLEKQLAALQTEQDVIQGNIQKYQVLISNLREATSAYKLWKDAQNAPEAGDMYSDIGKAFQQIDEGLSTGLTGTKKFDASLDLIVPTTIDHDDNRAIAEYKRNFLDKYLTFDDDGEMTVTGLKNFLSDSTERALMEFNGEEYSINPNVSMKDFAEKLNLTPEMVRSIFGKLEDYDFEFDWTDELEEQLAATDEEVEAYKNDINAKISELGNDPVILRVNSDELTNLEAELYELNNPELTEIHPTVKAQLQVQDELDLAKEKLDEAITNLKVGNISQEEFSETAGELEREIDRIEAKKQALAQPVSVYITAASNEIDAQIDKLKEELSDLEPGSDRTVEINTEITKLEKQKIALEVMLDSDEATEGVEETTSAMEKLDKMVAKPKVVVDTEQAIADIGLVGLALSDLPEETKSKIIIIHEDKYIKTGDSGENSGASARRDSSGGTSGASGTAFAYGNWGAKSGGRALVGELGREILVDPNTGKWRTVGDFGAEFVDIPKGAIIFNHKQTEDILSNGYVTSRGFALAKGNAYMKGTAYAEGISAVTGHGRPNWELQETWGYPSPGSSGNYDNTANAVSNANDKTEEYVSTLWQLYEVEKRLQDIQDYSSLLEIQLDMAKSTHEAISIQEKLLDAYKREQEAYHNLAEARRGLIKDKISELASQGFKIDYDAETNDLFIHNTEHINDLIGDTQEATNDMRKEAEEAIKTIIDWNKENTEASKSFWELSQSIQAAKKEIAEGSLGIFDDFIKYMDSFDLWTSGGPTKIEALKAKQKELNRLYAQGYLTIKQYQELTQENSKDIYDIQKESLKEVIELVEEMIRQETENQIEALEKEIEAYREIIRLRKEALQKAAEEEDHQDTLNEKLKEMAKLKSRIDKLDLAAKAGDRAAAAEKASLEEDYAKLQKELTDFQTDYVRDKQSEALDDELEKFEKTKNDEITKLKESIDTQVKLYEAAIARINSGWEATYNDLLAWNREYGDGISGDDSIKSAWLEAAEAVKQYGYNVEAALQGSKTENSWSNVNTQNRDEIISTMKANSEKWFTASPEDRKALVAANETLAKQLSGVVGRPVVKGVDGAWYFDKVGGQKVFDLLTQGNDQNTSAETEAAKNEKQAKIKAKVREMKTNSIKWQNATTSGDKAYWANENNRLADEVQSLLGNRKLVRGQDGIWYLDKVGGQRLYDIYHKGGIVGGQGSLKDNEVFSLLEKNEFVLNEGQKKSLYDLVAIGRSILPLTKEIRTGSPTAALAGDALNFNPEINVEINAQDGLDTDSARKCGIMAADIALKQLQKGLSKFGFITSKGNMLSPAT